MILYIIDNILIVTLAIAILLQLTLFLLEKIKTKKEILNIQSDIIVIKEKIKVARHDYIGIRGCLNLLLRSQGISLNPTDLEEVRIHLGKIINERKNSKNEKYSNKID